MILNIALMGRQMLDFTFGHVDGINVLIEVGFHPISQDPPVIKRPAESKIIAARTFVKKARFGEPGCVSARSYLLNIDVESAWVLAIGAESDLLTVMAPTAERMDRLRLSRQFFLDPAFAQIMIRAAAHSMNTE